MTSLQLTPVPTSSTNANTKNNSSSSTTDAPSEEVTLEDQRKINRFAMLNGKEEELDLILKDLKRRLENVEEASNELLLADDDDLDDDDLGDNDGKSKDFSNIHFKVGDAFIGINKEESEKLLEKKRKELEIEIHKIERRIAPMKEEMSNIKANLYAKFGNNINLDND